MFALQLEKESIQTRPLKNEREGKKSAQKTQIKEAVLEATEDSRSNV